MLEGMLRNKIGKYAGFYIETSVSPLSLSRSRAWASAVPTHRHEGRHRDCLLLSGSRWHVQLFPAHHCPGLSSSGALLAYSCGSQLSPSCTQPRSVKNEAKHNAEAWLGTLHGVSVRCAEHERESPALPLARTCLLRDHQTVEACIAKTYSLTTVRPSTSKLCPVGVEQVISRRGELGTID